LLGDWIAHPRRRFTPHRILELARLSLTTTHTPNQRHILGARYKGHGI
jgi:hypothetical protein